VLLFGAPYSTTNKGEVWTLQWTKKPVGLRLSVLAIIVQIININNNNNDSLTAISPPEESIEATPPSSRHRPGKGGGAKTKAKYLSGQNIYEKQMNFEGSAECGNR